MGYQALLFCPDEKLARVVSQVFSDLEFSVDPVTEPFGAVKKLMAQHYDALVVDFDNEQNAALLFKSARNSSFNQGSLAIAVVEGQAGVAKAYRIGANLVLTKPINVEQAKGTLRVARGLLRKNADANASSHSIPVMAPMTPPGPAGRQAQPVAQPANRSAEASASPAVARQSPGFAAATPAAASAMIDEKPATTPAPRVMPTATMATPAAESRKPVISRAPAENTLLAAEEAKKEAAKTESSKPIAAPLPSTTFRSQSAASAPAPAKEVAPPARKQADQEKDEIAEMEPASAAAFSADAASTADAPSFASFGEGDASGSGGSKKGLIVVLGIMALIAAGYFGWSKFSQQHSPPTPQPVITPQKGSAPKQEVLPMSAPAPEIPASPADKASAGTPVLSSKPSAGQVTTVNPQVTQIDLKPEPEAKKPVSAPLLVKPGTTVAKAPAPAEEPYAQPPSPLAVATPTDGGLGAVLSSTPTEAAQPTLAVIKVSQGVSQGLLIKRVPPKYPPNAKAAHIQGTVQIEATVNKEGSVVNPKVLSGDRMLAAAALEAVRQWRYKPYFLDGQPVEIQTQITIMFKTE